jgi:hypothetical protein
LQKILIKTIFDGSEQDSKSITKRKISKSQKIEQKTRELDIHENEKDGIIAVLKRNKQIFACKSCKLRFKNEK